MTDREYIKKFLVNDQQSLAKFYDNNIPKFIAFFKKKYRKDEQYSMDLFHESFMTLYENILRHKLTESTLTGSIYNYLIGIAIRKMLSADRKNHEFDKERLIQLDDNSEESINTNVKSVLKDEAMRLDTDSSHNELCTFVEKIVSDLTPPCNQLLINFYWNRMSGSEIAEIMDYQNVNSVKTQKNRCMKKIKPLIEKFKSVVCC